MNFIAFPVASVNLFPCANSVAGGQLLSEFNLRCRETVATNPNVRYIIGPSYTHSAEDFKVTMAIDGSGVTTSTTSITIAEGRALVNGHYIESLTPIDIDIADANAYLLEHDQEPLKGKCVVGLRAMYSTEATLATTLLTEGPGDVYRGIQVVILPKNEFILPEDSPEDETQITAHLKLAEFEYRNGSIIASSIKQNDSKVTVLSATQVSNLDELLESNIYVTKTGLNPKFIYTMSYKEDGEHSSFQWCDSTGSLMVWDENPQLMTGENPGVSSPVFYYDAVTDSVKMQIPHKQPDGMTDSSDNPQYYKDVVLNLPAANYNKGTGGVVTKAYTDRIKALQQNLTSLRYHFGTMRGYIEELDTRDIASQSGTVLVQLPPINPEWTVGDYILVNRDNTVAGDGFELSGTRPPSTAYVVIGGAPTLVKLNLVFIDHQYQIAKPDGLELAKVEANGVVYKEYKEGASTDVYSYIDSTNIGTIYTDLNREVLWTKTLTTGTEDSELTYLPETDPLTGGDFVSVVGPGFLSASGEDTAPATGFTVTGGSQVATNSEPGHDYITVEMYMSSDGGTTITKGEVYFVVGAVEDTAYSMPPIWITSQVPLATETSIGGFVNVPDTALGNGYVRLNEEGYLELLDFELLASGTLAYQLGADYTVSSGLAIDEIQSLLDNYVNDRVAFPNATQLLSSATPNIININIDLSESELAEAATLSIANIDSRFGTSVYVHLTGEVNSNLTINISNCEKVRLDLDLSGSCTINLLNSCLYYDVAVLNELTSISNMKLWYERYTEEDPNILVNGMTVEMIGSPEFVDSIDYWAPVAPNDNHYTYALRSITFADTGDIIGCGLLVTDKLTADQALGSFISVFEFNLPQSVGLPYPATRLTQQLKVTGSFITAYPYTELYDTGYLVKDTSFTALTNTYSTSSTVTGTIAFKTDVSQVNQISGIDVTTIDGWESGKFHLFYGGVV